MSLQHAEARYGQLIEHLREIVFLTDMNGCWTFLNPAWTEILGYSVEESLGSFYQQAMHPDDRPASLARYRMLLTGETRECRAVFRMFHKHGGLRWIEITGWMFRDDAGEPVGMAGTLNDVTEREVAKRALERERALLRSVLEGTEVATWTHNLVTDEATYSDRWATILGYTLDELGPPAYDTWADLVHPDDRPAVEHEWTFLATRERDYYENQFRMRHKQGHWVWIRSRGRITEWTDDDRPLMLAGTHTDITEQVLAEHAARRAQKLEALGRVAGGVAHDFNNLLGVILASADLLDADVDDGVDGDGDGADRATAAIRAAVGRAAALTRRLLEVAQQGRGTPEAVDLNAAVHSCDVLVGRALTPAIAVVYDLAAEPLPVELDAGLLADVLLNLAVNARDAMPEGGAFTIRSEARGAEVVLAVADTGTGIAPGVLGKVFDPFFSTKPNGSGLGLALAYAFARQADGDVSVASPPGGGTTFTFTFPRTAKAVAVSAEAPAGASEAGHGELILVVDDEGLLRELARMQLEGAGYQVATAGDATAALAVLAEQPRVRLVFSDVVMPGGTSGFGLAEQIRAAHPQVRVLLTSGNTLAPNRAGYDGPVLPKPYTRAALIDAIHQTLDS